MSDLPAPPPTASPSPRKRLPIGRLVVGVVVLSIGVAALLEALDVSVETWRVVLPGALIAVGLGLVATGFRSERSQGGLISIGIVLTLVLTVASIVDIPFEGGVGDRLESPTSQSQVKAEYRLALGELTIDLTELPLREPGVPTTRIRARVGIGQLVVIVPYDTIVSVRGHAGVGDVTVFDRSNSGFDVYNDLDAPVPAGVSPAYYFDVSVGLGEVEVRYG
ncbi:MAG: LiaF domain-containing protein [Actinomycetota bacterium]